MARKGARVVSAIVNVLKTREGYWDKQQFVDEYIQEYGIQYRVDAYRSHAKMFEAQPDDFDELGLPCMTKFILYRKQDHPRLKLRPDVDTEILIEDLGDETLRDIFCFTDCHWRV
ncbi:hypothetical protein CPB97_004731 [Podila verticillata]|nr:hypothetical protein CPB97_004731 [Podila verticillata]